KAARRVGGGAIAHKRPPPPPLPTTRKRSRGEGSGEARRVAFEMCACPSAFAGTTTERFADLVWQCAGGGASLLSSLTCNSPALSRKLLQGPARAHAGRLWRRHRQ